MLIEEIQSIYQSENRKTDKDSKDQYSIKFQSQCQVILHMRSIKIHYVGMKCKIYYLPCLLVLSFKLLSHDMHKNMLLSYEYHFIIYRFLTIKSNKRTYIHRQLEHAPDNDDATYQSNKSEASAAIQSARSQEEKAFEGYTKQKNMGFFDDSTSFKQWAAQNAPGYQAAYQ